MPSSGPTNQHKQQLEITAEDRDLLRRLLTEGGSKAMPGHMKALVAGVQMALGRYRQSKAEDHHRRSAREDFRELFMACADEKKTPKIRRKFPQLPVLPEKSYCVAQGPALPTGMAAPI